ncbi:MAG: hypothetical protein R3E31_10590 [Chloroflexota bacterium]
MHWRKYQKQPFGSSSTLMVQFADNLQLLLTKPNLDGKFRPLYNTNRRIIRRPGATRAPVL